MHADPTTAENTGAAPEWGAALWFQAALGAVLGFVSTAVWLFTGHDFFWPMWVWFGILFVVGMQGGIYAAQFIEDPAVRHLGLHGAVTGVLSVAQVLAWAFSGFGLFWPIFPIGVFAVAFAAHYLSVAPEGRQQLVDRVEQLTRTRSGALDVQAAELRRIERDLHDGAQARLVALSMQIGRAEARLADRPEEAELLRQARTEASAAIAELRDLARGIAPPVLADRGLGAAIEALGRRAAIEVAVDADLPSRPLPVVETAAYFVVTESLANVSKHAPEASARVSLRLDDKSLVVVISDNGPGGANPAGGGLSGLRGRVEALDGTLAVISEPGHGTTIKAEFPCA